MLNAVFHAASLIGFAGQAVMLSYSWAFKLDPLSELLRSDTANKVLDWYHTIGLLSIATYTYCFWMEYGLFSCLSSFGGTLVMLWLFNWFLSEIDKDLTYYQTVVDIHTVA